MINRELLQKLKAAGYPLQETEDFDYAPTIAHLLKVHGIHFDCLVNCGTHWQARSFIGGGIKADGQTPEEALANLWIYSNSQMRMTP